MGAAAHRRPGNRAFGSTHVVTLARSFDAVLAQPGPVLALAPMQDITDLPFLRLMARYGGADLYFTEYFRVYPGSHLNKHILRSVTENPTGRPVIAQMIGNDIPALVRSARELQRYPVAAIDLNLGCPAPVVYRKCAGGGLLRDPDKVDAILGALRETITTRFTVKTRVGFDSPEVFDRLLPIFARHSLDLLTVHGRTVAEMYRAPVRYELIARAAAALPCPVLANGNIYSAAKARDVLATTGARGLMIGRGAIRNPWIFSQIRALVQGENPPKQASRVESVNRVASPLPSHSPAQSGGEGGRRPGEGEAPFVPSGREVLAYLRDLYETVRPPDLPERAQVAKMKKYLNFLAVGAEPSGRFLHAIRRVESEAEFFRVCETFLDHDAPMPLEPFALDLKHCDVMAGEQR